MTMVDEMLEPSAEPQTEHVELRTLGQYLVESGLVTPVVIDYVLQKQAVEQGRLGNMLVELGFVTQKDVARFLAMQRKLAFLSAEQLVVDDEVLAGFNKNLCLTHGFLPLRREGQLLHVALGDADPEAIADLLRRRHGVECRFYQAEFDRLTMAIREHYYFAENPAEKLLTLEIKRLKEDVDRAYSPSKLLDFLIHLAIKERATDVHLAPTAGSRTILMRVDGVLRPMMSLPLELDRLISFVKLKADMDVAEQRLPQDGSFYAEIYDRTYTIRVSTLIAEFGERMVLRLLPERSDLDRLDDLGILREDVAIMEKIFSRPHGMILITGPTGSGKSTTLHAALRMQPVVERNVITVEDPVEYRVPAACQTEVNRRAGYDFASAMRHFLRHDPDIIFVGEIRDDETARAATDAASTGHLVLSTLHVGGIFGVMSRLSLLGIDSETIAENLIAVINQRLVRRICPACRDERPATEDEAEWLGVEPGHPLHYGKGCPQCRDIGYQGRLPVYELLVVDRELADGIAANLGRKALRELALSRGMRPILELARYRVLSGETTVEEIHRAVGEI